MRGITYLYYIAAFLTVLALLGLTVITIFVSFRYNEIAGARVGAQVAGYMFLTSLLPLSIMFWNTYVLHGASIITEREGCKNVY